MANKLIIHFREHSNELVDWALVDSTGHLLDSKTSFPLQDIQPPKAHCNLVAIIPATLLTLTTVEIPHTTQTKLVQAVPFAIETTTAANIDSLHFAIGTRNADDYLNIAYLDKALMQEWHSKLTAISCDLTSMYPDNLLLPLPENGWSIFIDAETALVRTGPQTGFNIDSDTLVTILQALAAENPPATIAVHNLTASSVLGKQLQTLKIPVDFHPKATYFELISADLTAPTAINLLQNNYRPRTKWLKMNKPWRIASQLAVLWLIIMFVGNIAQLVSLKYQQYRLNHTITHLYQQVFPTATTIDNVQAKITAELHKYQAPFQSQGLIDLLGKAGTIIHNSKTIKLQNIEFRDKQLQIQLTANSFATLDKLAAALKSQGLQVKRDKATTQNNLVSTKLTIGTK